MNLRRFIALFLALTMIFSLAFPGGFAFADDDIVYVDDAANDEEEFDDALEEEYAQDGHIHNLTYYPEAAASCAAPGNYECWYCADCGKFYADEACEYEVAFEELAIPATDEHSFQDGTCAVCGAKDPDYVAPAAVMLASALEETVVEETNDETPVAETVIEEKVAETPVAETVVEETVGEARPVEPAENTDEQQTPEQPDENGQPALASLDPQEVAQLGMGGAVAVLEARDVEAQLGEGVVMTPSDFINAIAGVTEYSNTVTVKFTDENVPGGNTHQDGYQIYLLGGYTPLRSTPITISNVTFDASEYTGNDVGIQLYLYTSADVTFTNCTFNKVGVSFNGAEDKSPNSDVKATFTNCSFSNFGNYAIQYVRNAAITGCTFTDCERAVMAYSHHDNDVLQTLNISGNTFNGMVKKRIIKLYNLVTDSNSSITVQNNTLNNCTAKLFQVTKDDARAVDSHYKILGTNTGVTAENLSEEGYIPLYIEGNNYVDVPSANVAQIDVDGTQTSVYKVADGFYQDGETYTASTNFYITSKAGLEYFRDLVSACDGGTVASAYATTWAGSSIPSWYTNNIFTNKTVHLLADIDLDNEDWTPIGYVNTAYNNGGSKTHFYGSFDGHKHKISNLKIVGNDNNTYKGYGSYGLFGYLGGKEGQTFSNLTIENVSGVTGTGTWDYVGALIGNAQSNPTYINNCHVTGTINLTGSYEVGGLYGIGKASVSSCSINGDSGSTITSTVYYAGGLAGATRAGVTVSNSTVSNVGIVSAYAGGLVGLNNNQTTFTDNKLSNTTINGVENADVDYGYPEKPEGATTSTNSSDNVTVIIPKAETGGVKYATLQKAVDAAASGSTVTLLKDVTESVDVIEKNITLNLGGNTLKAGSAEYALYIEDSNVSIIADANGCVDSAIYEAGHYAIFITSGEVTLSDPELTVKGVIENGDTVVVTAGKYSEDPSEFLTTAYKAMKPSGETLYEVTPVYTITYVLNEGENPADATASFTKFDVVTLPTPTKTNNQFGGWYTNEELTGESITTIPVGTTENKTFYAKWTENVAYIGDVGYPTLADAIEAANSDDIVEIVASGTYNLPNLSKNITLKGAENVEAVFDCIGNGNIANVASGTKFENLTFNMGNENYHGFQNNVVLDFEDCTFNGKFFTYGTETYKNCTFVQDNSDYHMWVYGGSKIVYDSCTFINNVTGKFLNVYNENNGAHELVVKDCEFINNGTESKAAINIKQTSGSAMLEYDVEISGDNTVVGSFPSSGLKDNAEHTLVGGNGLYQIDDRQDSEKEPKLDVEVTGNVVTKTTESDVGTSTSVNDAYPEYVVSVTDGSNTTTKYASLHAALDAAREAAAGNWNTTSVTVDILKDITFENGSTWTPVVYNQFNPITINGNNHTITGLPGMLYAKSGSGTSTLTINNLTFERPTVSIAGEYAAVIMGYADSVKGLEFNNVSINNATVTSGKYAAGFVGYAAGYSNVDDGPVYQHISFNNCSVTNSSFTGAGSTGALMGHANGSTDARVVVSGTTVTNNKVTSTGSDTNKAGALFGTVGALGPNNKDDAGLFVSAAVSGNTVSSNGTPITTVYGRQGSSSGRMTLTTGGSYDAQPIPAADLVAGWAKYDENSGAAVKADGSFTVITDTAAAESTSYVALLKSLDTYYATLGAAVDKAAETDTITLAGTVTDAASIPAGKTIRLELNGNNVTTETAVSTSGVLAISGEGIFNTYPTKSSEGKLAISGGYYPTKVLEADCADGYIPKNAETTGKGWTVEGGEIVARIGDPVTGTGYGTVKEALVASNALSDDVTIYILKDVTNDSAGIILNNNVTIDTVVEGGVTINFGDYYLLVTDGKTLTIADDITISSVGQLGTYENNGKVDIYGTVNCTQFYVLTGSVNVKPGAKVTYFYDGMLGMWRSGSINITGDLSNGAALTLDTSTAPAQVTGGYPKYFFGDNTISLKNTFVKNMAFIVGDNRYSNYNFALDMENSVLTTTGKIDLLGQSASTYNLTGSRLVVGDYITIYANDTLNMDATSSITTKTWTNNGTVNVDVSGLTAANLPHTIVTVTGDGTINPGTINLLNNTNNYVVGVDGKNIVISSGIVELTNGSNTYNFFYLADAIAKANELGGENVINLKGNTILSDYVENGYYNENNEWVDEPITVIGTATINSSTTVILNLNGHDVVGNVNGVMLQNDGTLTINDSENKGHFYNTNTSSSGHHAIYNYGTVTINGGTFGDADDDMTNDNPYQRGNALYNYGTATINGGKFTAINFLYNNQSVWSYAISNSSYGDYRGVMTINNATAYGKTNGLVWNDGYGTLTINDGSFTLSKSPTANYNYQVVGADGNSVTYIKGGTFNHESVGGEAPYALRTLNASQIYVSGGDFYYNKAIWGNWGYTRSVFEACGGTYTKNDVEPKIPVGLYDDPSTSTVDPKFYTIKAIENDRFEVTEDTSIVAYIGEGATAVGYTSFKDAAEAATTAQEPTAISLYTAGVDASDYTMAADGVLTVNLNGFTLAKNPNASDEEHYVKAEVSQDDKTLTLSDLEAAASVVLADDKATGYASFADAVAAMGETDKYVKLLANVTDSYHLAANKTLKVAKNSFNVTVVTDEEGKVVIEETSGDITTFSVITAPVSVTHKDEAEPYAYYATLKEAFENVVDGDTVNVLKDLENVSAANLGKKITLNLGTNTITSANSVTNMFVLNSGAELTITGNGGKILSGSENRTARVFRIYKDAVLTISDNVEIGFSSSSASATSVVFNAGTLNITANAHFGAGVNGNGTFNITAGYFKNDVSDYLGENYTVEEADGEYHVVPALAKLTHNGTKKGYLSFELAYVAASEGDTLTILMGDGTNETGTKIFLDDDTLDKNVTYVGTINVAEGNTLTINGSGVFASAPVADGGTLAIKGGKFDAYPTKSNNGVLKISGGLFKTPVELADCAEGYHPVASEDSEYLYTVDDGDAVASITRGEGAEAVTTYYTTLQDAIAASESGNTIELVANAELVRDNRFYPKAGTIIDGHGFSIIHTDIQVSKSPTIHITSGTVTIKNATVVSGATAGAAISTDKGTNLVLENVVLDHTKSDEFKRDALALNGDCVIKGSFKAILGVNNWSAISFNDTSTDTETLDLTECRSFEVVDNRTAGGSQPVIIAWCPGSTVLGSDQFFAPVFGTNTQTGFEPASSAKVGNENNPGTTYNFKANNKYFTTFALAAAEAFENNGTVEMFAAPADTDTFALNAGESLKVVKNGYTPVVKAVGEFEVKQNDVTTGDVTTTTYSLAAAVASITKGDPAVTSYFDTLQGAVDAAQNGDTVKLLVDLKDDTALTSRVEVNPGGGKSITIDLNGKSIIVTHTTGNGSAFNIVSGNITIQNGTIDGTGVKEGEGSNIAVADGICLVTVRNGATLNLADGIEMVIDSKNGSCVYPFAGGTVNISGGTYENQTDEDYQWKTGFKGLTVNQANNQGQLIHITGGTFIGNDPQLGDDSNGARAVEPGSVAMPANSTTAGQNGTYTVVPGGVVTFTADDVKFAEQRIASGEKATKPATDPTKPDSVFKEWVEEGKTGAFDFANTQITTDITLKASWDEAVARVTHTADATTTVTYFTTLPGAVTAANAGDTVTLLKDVDLDSTSLTIDKALTLDGTYNDVKHTIKANIGTGAMNGDGYKIYSNGSPALTVNTTEPVIIQNVDIEAWRAVRINSDSKVRQIDLEIRNVNMDVSQRGVTMDAGATAGSSLKITNCNIVRKDFSIDTQPYVNDEHSRGISLWDMVNSTVAITNSSINGFAYAVNCAGQSSANNITLNGTVSGTVIHARAAINSWGSGNTYTLDHCTVNGYNDQTGPTESFAMIVDNNGVTNNKYVVNGGSYNAWIGPKVGQNSSATVYLAALRGQNAKLLFEDDITYIINDPARGGIEERIAQKWQLNSSNEIHLDQDAYDNLKQYIDPNAYTITDSDILKYTLGQKPLVARNGTTGEKYYSLAAAVEDAQPGEKIYLMEDISLTETQVIDKSIDLNLNGHNITAHNCRALWIKSGDVDITAPQVEGKNIVSVIHDADDTTFASSSSVIRVGDSAANSTPADVTIGTYVTVSTNYCYGISVFGRNTGIDPNYPNSKPINLWVSGTVAVTGEAAAISGNGSAGLSETKITIGGGTVSATRDYAIYHPGRGELSVQSLSNVTGPGGIEIKAGTAEINGDVTATVASPSHSPSNDGTSTSGYAIAAVNNSNYPGQPSVVIGTYAHVEGKTIIVADNATINNASVTAESNQTNAADGYKWAQLGTNNYKLLKEATVTADALSKVYGETDPTLTATVSGVESGDSITYTLNRIAGENVRSYAINATYVPVQGNYAVTYVPNNFTIEPLTAELEWADDEFVYNTQPQVPTATVSNKVGDDEVNVTVSGAQTEPGDYTATASALTGAQAANYKLPENPTHSFTINEAYAKIGETYFTTLTAAVAAAQNDDKVELLKDATGNGVMITAANAKNITIDFGGHTYTMNGTPVGSPGTESQAFHFEKGCEITMENGTITSNTASMLVQNYCDLTLKNIELVGNGSYVLSNNNGNVVIGSGTKITATAANGVAFDVCVTNYYPDGVKVTVKDGAVINGNIEYGVWGSVPAENKTGLTINGGTINGTFVVDDALKTAAAEKLVINGGSFKDDKGNELNVPHNKILAKATESAAMYTLVDAVWVNFEAAGGTPDPAAQKIVKGTMATKPATDPTMAGFEFAGWFNGQTEWNFETDTVTSDVTLTARWSDAVASITSGDTTTYYSTLQKAFDVGGDIKLLKDVEEKVALASDKTATLDLNGHSVSNASKPNATIQNNGTLTIKDSIGYGKIISTNNFAVSVGSNSATTIGEAGSANNFSIESVEGAVITGRNTGATITINGGTLSASDNAVVAGNGSAGYGGNTITINDGTFNGGIISDGYVACGVYAPNNDVVTINGGTFNITGGAGVVARAGKVTIGNADGTGPVFNTSGNVTGKVGDSRVVVPCAAIVYDEAANYPGMNDDSKITVNGGTFHSYSDSVVTVGDGSEKRVEAKGGLFTQYIDPKSVTDGFLCTTVPNATPGSYGYYTIVAKRTVTFTVDEVEYLSTPVPNGEKVAKPESNPTKDGYTFKSWQLDGSDYDFNTAVTANITLTAAWEDVASYTVTFKDTDGSKLFDSQTVYTGEKAVFPGTPTKEHYSFNGWYNGDGDEVFSFATPITANTNLTAHWKAEKHNVIFLAADGTPVIQTSTVDHGAPVAEPTAPTRTGYTFAGWFKGADDTAAKFDFTTEITADTVLYAHWTINQYTITWSIDGVETKEIYNYGATPTHADPTKDATAEKTYTFTGWDPAIVEVIDNATYTAQFDEAARTYTVTFDSDGGSVVDALTVKYGDKATAPDDPTKDGFEFGGWYQVTDGKMSDTPYDFDSAVSTDVTLKAKWIGAVASIIRGESTTYYATLQGAVNAAAAGDTVLLLSDIDALTARVDVNKNLTIDLGGKTIKPTNESANGSAFNIVSGTVEIKNGTLDGTGVDETENGNVKIADGICLVTVRSGAILNLTDDNLHMVVNSKNGSCVYPFAGGTVNISGGTYVNQTAEEYGYKDGFKGLTVNQANVQGQLIHITGGIFIGNDPQLGDDSTGARFTADGYVAMPASGTIAGQNGTYNVVPGYLVNFETEGGTPAIAQQRIAKNGYATKPADLTKEGCTFVGWFNGDNEWKFDTTPVTEDVTLTAKWLDSADSITVTVSSSGDGGPSGSSVSNVTGGGVYAKNASVKVTTTTPSGYDFVGWYQNGTPVSGATTTDYTFKQGFTADARIVAVFRPNGSAKMHLLVTGSEFRTNLYDATQRSRMDADVEANKQVTITFTDDSKQFLYWINSSNKVLSTNKEYTFYLVQDTTITAVYYDKVTEAATEALLVFSSADANAQVISSFYVNASDIGSITFPTVPARMGTTGGFWSMDGQAEATAESIKGAIPTSGGQIVLKPVYTASDAKYSVTVIYVDESGNVIKRETPYTGINVGTGKYVTVAEELNGKNFAYWSDAAVEGTILGYSTTYRVRPTADITLYAVYSENEVEVQPTVNLTNAYATINGSKYRVSFTSTRNVPEGYTVEDVGMLYARAENIDTSSETAIKAVLVLDSENENVKIQKSSSRDLTGTHTANIGTSVSDRVFYARAYVVIRNTQSEELTTIYSDLMSGSYATLSE